MKGIIFINEHVAFEGLSREESFHVQHKCIMNYVSEKKISLVTLNPEQINPYYTIPHALLYDLREQGPVLDCLVTYSDQVLEGFIDMYPARWLLLKSFFKNVISVSNHDASSVIA